MKSEDIVYNQSEETQFDVNDNELSEKKEIEKVNSVEEVKDSKSKSFLKGEWQTIAVGSGTGLIFGAAGSILANELKAEEVAPIKPGPHSDPHNPLIVDDDIAVATCIDDRMTFSQAFAAARAEVGSGGVFEWHGNLYGTYYAAEWNAMTPEQKEEYNNHFAWGRTHAEHHSSETTGSHHDTPSTNHESDQAANTNSENHDVNTHDDNHASNQVTDNHNASHVDNHASNQVIDNHNASHEDNHASNEVLAHVEEPDDDSQVEVLGVVQNGQDGLADGSTVIAAQDGYIVDFIGDLLFSSLVADTDTKEVSTTENVDPSSSQVLVENMEGFINEGTDHLVDSTDEIDYVD